MPRMNVFRLLMGAALMALLFVARATAEEADQPPPAPADRAAPVPEQPAAPPADEKGPPLPFHTIEGYAGGAITPFAYLSNPGKEECLWGKPAAALSFVNARQKDLAAVTMSETLFGRVELSYGGDRLGLGTLPGDIDAFGDRNNIAGIGIEENAVWLHNFNIRALLVKENDCLFGFKAPAITAGIHFKYNSDIEHIDQELGGALHGIGYRRSNGEDFTLTMTETFPKLLLDRPVVASVGLRLSQAANLGFLGFGDTYHATFEGNLAWLPFDKLLLAYEFRQKSDPYGTIPNGIGGYLIGGEDNWHAFDLGLILNQHSTIVAGWGIFGTLANTTADNSWFLQYKYEF
jgi:hypothetical protein